MKAVPDHPLADVGEQDDPGPTVARPQPERDNRSERMLIRREPVPRPPAAPPRRPSWQRRARPGPDEPRAKPELGFFRGLLIAVPVSVLLWVCLIALVRWALPR